MPSAFGHVAPALALIPAFSRAGVSRRVWALGALCAVAPDLDVLAFALGVPYDHPLGHRGLWHSVPFAGLLAACVAFAATAGQTASPFRLRVWLYLFLATASHGILDAFTNGGLGVALLGPFDWSRYFFPFRPIEVSPLSIPGFFSARGASILASELVWIWLPAGAFGLTVLAARRRGWGTGPGRPDRRRTGT